MSRESVYYSLKGNFFVIIEKNPCGCHPNDYLVSYSKTKKHTWCCDNLSDFKENIKLLKWEYIGDL